MSWDSEFAQQTQEFETMQRNILAGLIIILLCLVCFGAGVLYKESSYESTGQVYSKLETFHTNLETNEQYNKKYYLIINVKHLRKIEVDEKTFNNYWLKDTYPRTFEEN